MSEKFRIDSGQTNEEVFKIILYQNFVLMQKYEPLVFKGKDSEGVHQMRIALRKMRSLIAVFKPILHNETTIHIASEMKTIASMFDRARDIDVYLHNYLEQRKTNSAKLMYKTVKRHKENEYKKLKTFLKSQEYKYFKEELLHWINTNGWDYKLPKKSKNRLNEKVTPFALEILENYKKRVYSFGGKNIEHLDDETLHLLRIKCKKLRYASEFFTPLFEEEIKHFRKNLKKLQDILGVLHDYAVTKELHRIFLRDQKTKKALEFAMKIEQQQFEQSRDLKKKLRSQWLKFSTSLEED